MPFGLSATINGLWNLGNSAANAYFNSKEAKKQRDWASGEAQKQRDWQTEMSNTSYTRAVKDLRNADLNPLLAVTGMSGASTPSGGVPSGASASGDLRGENPITMARQQENLKSQSKLNEANTGVAKANEENARSQTKYNLAAISQLDETIAKLRSEINMNAILNASNAEDLKFKKQKNDILLEQMKKNPMAVFQNEFGGNQGAAAGIQAGANIITDKLNPIVPHAIKFGKKILSIPNPYFYGAKKLRDVYKHSNVQR